MKKLFAVILAMGMLCSFAVSASAADDLMAQGEALLQETLHILSSETFTMAGRSSTTDLYTGESSGMQALIFARNGDALAIETETDWAEMTQSRIMGFAARLLLGKRMRMVMTPEHNIIVFPDRRFYVSLDGLAGEPIAVPEIFQVVNAAEITEAAEVTLEGERYVRLNLNQGESYLYYQEDQLKRAESYEDGILISVIEFDSLTATADEGYFSSKCMCKLSLTLIIRIFSLLNLY